MSARDKYDPQGFKKFLVEEGMAERVHALSAKKIMAEDLRRQMKKKRMTLKRLSREMKTSRTVVYSLLDPKAGVTLDTLFKACSALDLTFSLKPTRGGATIRRGSAAKRGKIIRRTPIAAREHRRSRMPPSVKTRPNRPGNTKESGV
jgi:hypothetical protein